MLIVMTQPKLVIDQSKRKFLINSSILSLFGMTGCSFTMPGMRYYQDSKRIIIDAHCHVLNQDDADAGAFIHRHDVGSIPTYLRDIFNIARVFTINLPTRVNMLDIKDEIKWLEKNRFALQGDPYLFYKIATDKQSFNWGEYDLAPSSNLRTGFFSNRTRNAARLTLDYPQVDIFMPSMVDFFEGDSNDYSSQEDLVKYYSLLNIASLGRFLPLVSFNPDRAAAFESTNQADKDRAGKTHPLELVKQAINDYGFIGVKLHPSSGFNPVENNPEGCTDGEEGRPFDAIEGKTIDKIMKDLFEYCQANHVPIMLHSGHAILASQDCQEERKDTHEDYPEFERRKNEKDWTNAPKYWIKVLKDFPQLKITIAHMAGGFNTNNGQLTPKPWLEIMLEYLRDSLTNSKSHLYLDLSYVTELFTDGQIPSSIRTEFCEFLQKNPALKTSLLYGTDWHMPGAPGPAQIGADYLLEYDATLPNDMRDNIMGLNAVEFYGLREGSENRNRLNRFFKENQIPLDKVLWMQKS